MTDQIIVQYMGFESKGSVREYAFAVREAAREPCEYTVTIANEAFESHRVRYQDAPSICSRRLQQELAANANHPPTSHFCVTDAELTAYSDAHRPKPLRGFQTRRED